MIKNTDYKASITASKGGKHFINIVSSTAFSALLVVIVKEFTDKNFEITDIKGAIDSISGALVIVTPIMASLIKMGTNFKNNFFKKI